MSNMTLCSGFITLCSNINMSLRRPNGDLFMSFFVFLCSMLIISTSSLFVSLSGLLWITSLDLRHAQAKLAHRDQMFWSCGSVNKIVCFSRCFVVYDNAFRGTESWLVYVQWNEILHFVHFLSLSLSSLLFTSLFILHVKALSLFHFLLYYLGSFS